MTNLVLHATQSPVTWTDTGGTETLDLGGLAADAVRAGDIHDFGASDKSTWYEWQFIVDGFDTAPVVGESVDIYVALSHNNTAGEITGDLSGTDGASSTVVLPNLLYLGSAVVQTTTAANELSISGLIKLRHRYLIPVVHNATADALLSTADAHKFILTPVPDNIQNAA